MNQQYEARVQPSCGHGRACGRTWGQLRFFLLFLWHCDVTSTVDGRTLISVIQTHRREVYPHSSHSSSVLFGLRQLSMLALACIWNMFVFMCTLLDPKRCFNVFHQVSSYAHCPQLKLSVNQGNKNKSIHCSKDQRASPSYFFPPFPLPLNCSPPWSFVLPPPLPSTKCPDNSTAVRRAE